MKNKNVHSATMLGLLLLGSVSSLQATELVYTPKNPAFGGSPLNGSYLLGNAQAQNDYDDPDAKSSSSGMSAIQRFTSQLQSSLLSQVLTNARNGKAGSVTTDDFIVNILNDETGQLVIHITDRVTGEVSEIAVNGLAGTTY
ncbi:curli production assembly protein CsgF [Pseudomonas luteola]|uniref:curli assembly protein CsgF n=1 Tax=Pseudomonas TaxID=286 RepID=UPI000F77D210|nr:MULTISPECIES: curli assembly protein CsgF [Pseudomonas]MBW5414686.1 curli production assembly protein CsgF [Pseudomonas sp. MAG002Y]MCG7373774.1 curli production assembly protein CsgF [Pseudomonas luteola]RRW43680.1 curli production assembly protein CsgF [Pseudomonas luteola]